MLSATESCAPLLEQHFGPGVLCAAVPTDENPAVLWDEERAVVAAAVPGRQGEFAAGRASARQLLNRLGLPAAAIPSAVDRSPVWPPGVIGSIAHHARLCVVAMARSGPLDSLGVDTEPDEPLEPSLWPEICTPLELASLSIRPRTERGRTARLLFSAKECAYKCAWPLTRRSFGFRDIEISLGPGPGRFRANLYSEAGSSVLRLVGFHLVASGSLLTGCALRVASAPDMASARSALCR